MGYAYGFKEDLENLLTNRKKLQERFHVNNGFKKNSSRCFAVHFRPDILYGKIPGRKKVFKSLVFEVVCVITIDLTTSPELYYL